MAKIKQLFFILWSIHILWSQDKSALKNIVKDAPDICTAPFSKMITYVSIRHQKFIAQRKSSISKVIFTSRNMQVVLLCIFINVCIHCRSFPSCNCINKTKSKVTTKINFEKVAIQVQGVRYEYDFCLLHQWHPWKMARISGYCRSEVVLNCVQLASGHMLCKRVGMRKLQAFFKSI